MGHSYESIPHLLKGIRGKAAGEFGLARVVAISLLRQKILVEPIISGYRRYMYLKVRLY